MKLTRSTVYIPEMTSALQFAAKGLEQNGITPSAHSGDLILLPVPGMITGDLWKTIPRDVPIFGGNLPADGHCTYDLLKDEIYLAKNAMITAHCAVTLAAETLPVTVENWKVLVIGYGRIGTCLAEILKRNGAEVTVCSSKEKNRAICEALGYSVIAPEQLINYLTKFRVVFNTAPAPILTDCNNVAEDTLLIDLASVPGILDKRVIWARGLPGKMAPESSGKLIAQSILRVLTERGSL